MFALKAILHYVLYFCHNTYIDFRDRQVTVA